MSGRPFLQIPGPSIVPERVIRAMSQPLIDHRGPQFAVVLGEVLDALKKLFQTAQGKILLFPGSGTGGWESCIVNTLSPGDQVLGCVNGHFSDLYCRTATSHGVNVQRLEVDYGAGVPASALEERLRLDKERQIKAVLVVQTETSTGVGNAAVLAYANLSLGDADKAIQLLEKAYVQHEPDLRALTYDRRWLTLRSDARFRAIASRVGLPKFKD